MKRHFGILTALCIVTLAMVAYFAQVIDAQSGPSTQMTWEASTSMEVSSNGEVCVSADDEPVSVKTNGEVIEAIFNADFCVSDDTAEGEIRLDFESEETTVFEIRDGWVEYRSDGSVQFIKVCLEIDGLSLTGTATPTSNGDDEDDFDIILFDIVG